MLKISLFKVPFIFTVSSYSVWLVYFLWQMGSRVGYVSIHISSILLGMLSNIWLIPFWLLISICACQHYRIYIPTIKNIGIIFIIALLTFLLMYILVLFRINGFLSLNLVEFIGDYAGILLGIFLLLESLIHAAFIWLCFKLLRPFFDTTEVLDRMSVPNYPVIHNLIYCFFFSVCNLIIMNAFLYSFSFNYSVQDILYPLIISNLLILFVNIIFIYFVNRRYFVETSIVLSPAKLIKSSGITFVLYMIVMMILMTILGYAISELLGKLLNGYYHKLPELLGFLAIICLVVNFSLLFIINRWSVRKMINKNSTSFID